MMGNFSLNDVLIDVERTNITLCTVIVNLLNKRKNFLCVASADALISILLNYLYDYNA